MYATALSQKIHFMVMYYDPIKETWLHKKKIWGVSPLCTSKLQHSDQYCLYIQI